MAGRPDASGRAEAGVRRRRLFFISGFDPQGPAHYHRLYAEQAALQAAVSGYRVAVGPRGERGCGGVELVGTLAGGHGGGRRRRDDVRVPALGRHRARSLGAWTVARHAGDVDEHGASDPQWGPCGES